MLAHIEKIEDGCFARFERDFHVTKEIVWSHLTENEKLKQWFPELHIETLTKGGLIQFNMHDVTIEKMEILDLKTNELMDFTWGDDIVQFELTSKENGCQLILSEKIRKITEQTVKDLAGWHVCLDVIASLIEGKSFTSREKEWEKWYKEYTHILNVFKK